MTALPPASRNVGLIGIGLLGSALAERLIAAGFAVIGFDLEPARMETFRRSGGAAATDANDVFRRCDRVLLSLPTHREAASVVRGSAAGIRSGRIVIDTSTGDPASAELLAAELSAQGAAYLDATVSGSSANMRAGTAVLMVGGAEPAFTACADLFACLGAQTFHTGAPGTGARMKLVTNLVLGLNRAALAEGLALAGGTGLDPAQALAIMRAGPAYSRIMDTKGGKMLHAEFSPEARLAQHRKDVRLILEQGRAAGLAMPLSTTHEAILAAAEAAGLGGLDNSAIIQVLATRTPPPATE